MQDSEQTSVSAAAAGDVDHGGRGVPDARGSAGPLWQVLGPFTRTGGFYARSWADYLDRQPGELPVARPTLALAAQAFSDEIVLLGFRFLRSAPDATRVERINREVIAALEFYGQKGWLGKPEGFVAAPPPLSDVAVRPVTSLGRTYERMFFDSEYEPCAGDPGRERWLSYTSNNREYALMLRHREPRPWLVCVHGAEMGRAALDLALFRAWHLHHDLGLNVTQHALRSAIPTSDAPSWIHCEKRVVPNPFDQQSKTSVGLRQLGLEDGAIALPEKCLTQRTKQIAGCLEGCAADRTLLSSHIPKLLLRNTNLVGYAPQR